MAWSNADIISLLERKGPVFLLWPEAILDKKVTANNAENYRVFPGKIKSKANEYGLERPDDSNIRAVYTELTRNRVGPNSQTIIVPDRENYVKLTSTGWTLVQKIRYEDELQDYLKTQLGSEIDEDEDDWYVVDVPDEAPVQLTAISPQPEDWRKGCDIEARGEFECRYPDCDGSVEEPFELEHPQETWSKSVIGECTNGHKWEFFVGQPFKEPLDPEA